MGSTSMPARRSPWSRSRRRTPAATTTAASPFVITAAATGRSTASSTSSATSCNVEAQVLRLEYDPNRSAYIALVEYPDSERRYILAPVGLAAGDVIVAGEGADIKPGNCSASGEHPRGYRYPQHRTVPGQGCAARPFRGQRRAAHGEGRRLSRPSVCRPAKCARSA